MLEPAILLQVVLCVVIGEAVFHTVKPFAVIMKKGIKAIARRLAD